MRALPKKKHLARFKTRWRWKCRCCGCLPWRACDGGCYWYERKLCSVCAHIIYDPDTL